MSKFITLLSIGLILGHSQVIAQGLNKKLTKYVTSLSGEIDQVDQERKESLEEIGDFIVKELNEDNKANVLVICTHNSRRSHISQVWLHTAAVYYGIEGINAFSGGTEATAFNENAVEALRRAGFVIRDGVGENPKYQVKVGSSNWVHYSKKYMDGQNPSSDFAAVMVCSEADKSCPVVKGADARFALPYDDPRYYDDTPSKESAYDNTVRLIGKEMFYVMNYVKGQMISKEEERKSNG